MDEDAVLALLAELERVLDDLGLGNLVAQANTQTAEDTSWLNRELPRR